MAGGGDCSCGVRRIGQLFKRSAKASALPEALPAPAKGPAPAGPPAAAPPRALAASEEAVVAAPTHADRPAGGEAPAITEVPEPTQAVLPEPPALEQVATAASDSESSQEDSQQTSSPEAAERHQAQARPLPQAARAALVPPLALSPQAARPQEALPQEAPPQSTAPQAPPLPQSGPLHAQRASSSPRQATEAPQLVDVPLSNNLYRPYVAPGPKVSSFEARLEAEKHVAANEDLLRMLTKLTEDLQRSNIITSPRPN